LIPARLDEAQAIREGARGTAAEKRALAHEEGGYKQRSQESKKTGKLSTRNVEKAKNLRVPSIPPSLRPNGRNTLLIALGGTVAVGVPSTINAIGNPTTRAVIELLALVVIFGLGVLVERPKKGS